MPIRPRQLLPLSLSALACLLGTGCVSSPTLLQVARARQCGDKNSISCDYHITDRDVLDFSDITKRKLASRFDRDRVARFGTSATSYTLGGLAGAAKTFGWAAGSASGYGLGATYIFGLGQVFDTKGSAQAYEHAFTEIEHAEAVYYFHQLRMKFPRDEKGVGHIDDTLYRANGNIPSKDELTIDGETLFYRIGKITKVLNDALANKIPDLQDLKDAEGDKSTTSTISPTARK